MPNGAQNAAPAARAGGASAAQLIARLLQRGETLAIAESLTGGLLISEFIAIPGASAVVTGGVVAYNTELKHTLLGVDADALAAHGPVHADVAAQMAAGVRVALAVAGRPADVGISTTGVAGPEPQDGHPVGTVFLGFAVGDRVTTQALRLSGSREDIRRAVVSESISELARLLM